MPTDNVQQEKLLRPTLHVEVLVQGHSLDAELGQEICDDVFQMLRDNYVTVTVGQEINELGQIRHGNLIEHIVVADYTGPDGYATFHDLQDVQLDVRPYVLKAEPQDGRDKRRIAQLDEDRLQARVLQLPHIELKDEWSSLAFEDALPARLLRCIVRMVGIMTHPAMKLGTFNLNRLCLLYGPSGSGKSTLCRALAQKLSIRLGNVFAACVLVEINANSLLSKYFGESGKLICSTFDEIYEMAQTSSNLVCVVIDEVETIAGSREMASKGRECSDSLRATNQLLTALDRLRNLSNVLILCTSNLVEAIDPAFLDRVDIKQLIPRPSVSAIYNIYRSCLNELVRSRLIDSAPSSPRQDENAILEPLTIPSFAEASVKYSLQPSASPSRVLDLARRCEGLSGRTLRRLPILALTMHTWGGRCTLPDAVTALEASVEDELRHANEEAREA